jgi:GT2 family glycosyltransferase
MGRPEVIDSAGQEYHICGWAFERRHGQTIAQGDLVPRLIFGPSASCGFYRREALSRVGGLWSLCDAYLDDTDLAFRLAWAGYRCMYEPAARIAHLGSASYGRGSDRHIYLVSRNEEIVFWADLPRSALALGLLPHLGFLAVRLLRKLFTGQAWPFLRGKFDALRTWRAVMERRRGLSDLAAAGPTPIDLGLFANLGVITQGIGWLRHRKCA